MISQIRLSRFKKFKDVTIKLKPFSILMGENSSGKTTVIQAINLALNIFSRHSFIIEGSNSTKIRTRGVGMYHLLGLTMSDYRELYYSKVSRQGNKKKVDGAAIGAIIELQDEKTNKLRLQVSSLFGSFNVRCISTDQEVKFSPILHKKAALYISGFVGLRPTEERSFPMAIQEKLLSGEASTIIRNLILDTKENAPDNFKLLKDRLKRDFGFTLDDIDFNANSDIHVKANYAESCEGNKLTLDFNSSGSGFMQVLQILTPIYRFCPLYSNIVLLDEPDAHLHPNLQGTLAKALREIQVELNVQIIVSTHSTTIIRLADPNEVIPISANSLVNEPLLTDEDVENEITSKIDTYSLGKSILSGKLLFIEDSNIEILETFDKILSTGVFSGANTVPILVGRGKDDKIPFSLKDVLAKFTKKTVETIFIRDGDSISGQLRTELLQYAASKNVRLHLFERHEIENYILSPTLFERALVKKYPNKEKPSLAEIKSKIAESLRNTIILSTYRFDDNLEDSIYKTSLLLGKSEYRNPQLSKSDAIALREEYERILDFDILLKCGMGKEALKSVMNWLNEKGIGISRKELLRSLELEDIQGEIKELLTSLRSKEVKPMPEQLPLFPEESLNYTDFDEQEEEQEAAELLAKNEEINS
jgi:AAA15 family ATPase/GTPase